MAVRDLFLHHGAHGRRGRHFGRGLRAAELFRRELLSRRRGRRLPRPAPDHFRRGHRPRGIHLYGHRHPRHRHHHLRHRHFQERVAAVHGALRGLPDDRLCQCPQSDL